MEKAVTVSPILPQSYQPEAGPLLSSLPTSCVVSGFVFKRFHKETGWKNWKRRFATVDVSSTLPGHSILRYYKSRQSDTPRGEITLVAGLHCSLRVSPAEMASSASIKMPAPCPNGHLIVIAETRNGSAVGSLFLCFDSTHDCDRWQTAFEAILPGSGSQEARSMSFLGGSIQSRHQSANNRRSGDDNAASGRLRSNASNSTALDER